MNKQSKSTFLHILDHFEEDVVRDMDLSAIDVHQSLPLNLEKRWILSLYSFEVDKEKLR